MAGDRLDWVVCHASRGSDAVVHRAAQAVYRENKFITLTIIPMILIMQGLGALYGSLYVTSWHDLSIWMRSFFVVYTVVFVFMIFYSQYGNIESMCTTVTPDGHLYWNTRVQSSVLPSTDTQTILFHSVVLALPLLILWKNKIELLYFLAIPFLAVLYSTRTDSAGSVWCYFTSFSSVAFSLHLLAHQCGLL